MPSCGKCYYYYQYYALSQYTVSISRRISPVPNLQLPTVLPAHVPSRTIHHPANSLGDHPPASPFFDPRSPFISCSPIEPYPSLHQVSGMTYHLNSAPFLYLHHHHCQSQDIIFIRLLYSSHPGPSAEN